MPYRARMPRVLIANTKERIRAIAEATGSDYIGFNDLLCDQTTCWARIGDEDLKDQALDSDLSAFSK